MKKKLLIHGGSSLISKYFLRNCVDEFNEFHIFCRDIVKTKSNLNINNYENNGKKFFFYVNDLNDLNQTIVDINKLPNDLSGIFWVTGYMGDVNLEITNYEKAKESLDVNFINVALSITLLLKKILLQRSTFICVITSVAGLRGRSNRLYYSSAKGGLINFMSGLRQMYKNKIKIITIIPGYISTKDFSSKGFNLLVTSPEKAANIISECIRKNKPVVYINFLWKYIMIIINLIPERIFKRFNF